MTVTSIIDILKIKRPEDLFTFGDIKNEYRKLAKMYHPDVTGNKYHEDVFIHITKLYEQGLDKITKGYWNSFGLLSVTAVNGSKYNIKYRYTKAFELGTMYVNDTIVAYEIDKKYEKLYSAYVQNVTNLQYRDTHMEKEFKRYFPIIKAQIITKDKYIIVLNKSKDALPLSVALNYFDGIIEPKGAAWIMSRLHNIHCFLYYNKIAHNDISVDTVFISPEHHSVMIYGGWWYSKTIGEKLIGMPTYAFDYMTPKNKKNKTADGLIDGELMRLTLRTILGDASGISLVSKHNVPEAFASWVRLPGTNKPVKDYHAWQDVLDKAFGERKFIPMNVDINAAYNKYL